MAKVPRNEQQKFEKRIQDLKAKPQGMSDKTWQTLLDAKVAGKDQNERFLSKQGSQMEDFDFHECFDEGVEHLDDEMDTVETDDKESCRNCELFEAIVYQMNTILKGEGSLKAKMLRIQDVIAIASLF